MRIGLLTSVGRTIDAFFPGIVSYWRAKGNFVAIAASTPSKLLKSEVITQLSRRPMLKNVGAPSAIDDWAARNRLDLIITNTAVASFAARARDPRVPVIYFCHGLHWNRGTAINDRAWQALESVALRNTAGIIAINRDDLRWFKDRFPNERITHSKSGVGVPLTKYPMIAFPSQEQLLRLVWIGDLSYRKRPLLAIEVVRHLIEHNTPVILEMYGEGPLLQETADLVSRYGLAHNVRLAGWTKLASDAIGRSHALLHTASWEGLPRVTLEALAIGRRTYAFDVKGVRDVPQIALVEDMNTSALATTIGEDWKSGAMELTADHRHELDDRRVAERLLEFCSRVTGAAQQNGGIN